MWSLTSDCSLFDRLGQEDYELRHPVSRLNATFRSNKAFFGEKIENPPTGRRNWGLPEAASDPWSPETLKGRISLLSHPASAVIRRLGLRATVWVPIVRRAGSPYRLRRKRCGPLDLAARMR